MVENFVENPIIFPFQVIRGFLFSLSVLPLVYMLKAKSKQLLVSLIFVYCSIGIVMLIPNFLFPDAVRWAHFWELVGSMLVFAVLSWYLFSRGQKWKKDRLLIVGDLAQKQKEADEFISQALEQFFIKNGIEFS